jgi:hypothetical protein
MLSLLANFGLALSLVWANTQRTGLGYELRRQQQAINELADLNSKLEIERDHLLSPYTLDRKAAELGLRGARPGQKRFMRWSATEK